MGVATSCTSDDVASLKGNYTQTSADLESLKTALTELQTKAIAENAAAVAKVEVAVQTLSDSFSTFKTEIHASIATINSSIMAIEGRLTTAETNISALEKKTDDIKTDVGSLKTTVNDLVTQVGTMSYDITILKDDVSTLKSQVKTNIEDTLYVKVVMKVAIYPNTVGVTADDITYPVYKAKGWDKTIAALRKEYDDFCTAYNISDTAEKATDVEEVIGNDDDTIVKEYYTLVDLETNLAWWKNEWNNVEQVAKVVKDYVKTNIKENTILLEFLISEDIVRHTQLGVRDDPFSSFKNS